MKIRSVFLSLVLLSSACGSSFKGNSDNAQSNNGIQGGSANSDLAELQSNEPTHIASLVSAFGYAPSSTAALLLAFYQGNRYFGGVVKVVEANVYQMEAGVGYYTEANGTMTLAPKKNTCPTVVHAAGVISGSDQSDRLVLTAAAETVELPRIAVGTSSPQGLVIQWGCFDTATGAFTAHAWTDVN